MEATFFEVRLSVGIFLIIAGAFLANRMQVRNERRIKRMRERYSLKREEEAKQARRRKEAERERGRRERARMIQNAKDGFAELLDRCLSKHEQAKDLVLDSEVQLDIASQEFEERAFAPFWDAIERSAVNLARYSRALAAIGDSAVLYRTKLRDLPARLGEHADRVLAEIPRFRIPAGKLPDARPVERRLSDLVRKVQKDFQFASIYEHRKTNRILVEGFSSLGSAIYDLSSAVDNSLQDLSYSIETPLNEILFEEGQAVALIDDIKRSIE